ncbi:MAG: nicotinate-nucleotide--dimethylbenzimidazole phosphoribosyltransferase [Candidatus Omnitrophica bacterium 4484_70.1]|nr:MAG: nicotinate-nucleotide--dimethylbenzimidazole phosphoribosyltransferase [Candidatus Omnitrophica bacterium 4484_70.1]
MQKLKETISKIEELDFSLMEETQKRLDTFTKPKGSLGRLEEITRQVVGITKKRNPSFKNKVIFVTAADHGVTEEGVSAYPKEVTSQMVYNFIKGGAAINVLAQHVGARVVVVDMGVASKLQITNCKLQNFRDKKINYGTKNMVRGPAMTRREAIRAIEAGIEVFEEELSRGIDIVATGDMGIGNTTSSSAIASCLVGKSVRDLTGRGTGISDEVFLRKIEIIEKAIRINQPNPSDPVDVLSKVGGFEIGGLVGVILASVSKRVPVVIDGFISGAAALIACSLKKEVKDFLIAGHCSAEKGHKLILEYLGLSPLLNLDMRLGEGTGAALGISIVEASIKLLTQMATFEEAGVSTKIGE